MSCSTLHAAAETAAANGPERLRTGTAAGPAPAGKIGPPFERPPLARTAEAGRAARNAKANNAKASGTPAGGGPQRPPSSLDKTAEKLLRAFNTWAFKREQPSDPHLLIQVATGAVARGVPLRFVLYWGKGPRDTVAAPELECLDYLAAMAARVREAHPPGAALTLILTDTHAALNGHSAARIDRYFGEVGHEAQARGFATCRLSEVTRTAEPLVGPLPDEAPPEEVLENLEASALKWYRGDGTAEDGAKRYWRINMLEKRAVEIAFPGSVFVTFNGSKVRSLFPTRLPVFYMYSLRRGVGVKPWFLDDEAAAGDGEASA
ncbi:hypothetical protein A33M_2012 [Rhodovulum sp. PH10]|uniref:hypothetical protein n=1 Tax=Rhodovulum sp. PH10 TaxID=1187851 RepID=UPI00027C2BF3|nr:hypothetical protein [Rhodovulum sp. PH10]EJW12441.1 hypothetical protein A33M_2012 [Rhodovulum sp. PH10]